MIIIKEKRKSTPIYIMRNDVENVTGGDNETYITEAELNSKLSDYPTIDEVGAQLSTKQDNLISGDNIKTINGESVLGSGNLEITADVDLSDYYTKGEMNNKLGDYATIVVMNNVDNSLRADINSVNDKIDNIVVPTLTSQLTNDSGYVTESELDNIIGSMGSSVPYVIFKNKAYTDSFNVVGDLNKVVEAVKNQTPYLAYYHNLTSVYGVYNALYLVNFAKYDETTNSGSFYFHIESGDSTGKHRTNEIPFSFNGTNYVTGFLKYATHNYITSIPDEYVTDSELNAKGYATESWVNTQIGNINNALENIIG